MRESELEKVAALIRELLEAGSPEKRSRAKHAIELQILIYEAAKEPLIRNSEYCLAQARAIDAAIQTFKNVGVITNEK